MKRYLVGLGVMMLLELIVFLVPLFGPGRIQLLLASLPATAAVLGILYPLWPRLRTSTARLVTALAGGWLTMLLTAVLLAVLAPDPLAPQAIAARGWATYLLVDKALRGLLSGLLWGTFAYVWAWAPIGYATMLVMQRVRPAAAATPPPARRP